MKEGGGSSFRAEAMPADRFLQEYPKPVVLQFQPTEFTLLKEPEDLRLWEALLVERVGIKGDIGRAITDAISANGGTCCESGGTNDCDAD